MKIVDPALKKTYSVCLDKLSHIKVIVGQLSIGTVPTFSLQMNIRQTHLLTF